ncbi:MAG TPA: serine O-acetyltransferase EpsC [Bacteroidales bacterium]|nr:serine O-acetyltransferase EpsC [Bacteroidales bacterium]
MVSTIETIKCRYSGDYVPSKSGVSDFLLRITSTLFPVTEAGDYRPASANKLRKKLIRLLKPIRKKLTRKPSEIADDFFKDLPDIEKMLLKDAEFIALNDPASTGPDEVIMAYPGFFAILVYRIAHLMASFGVPVIPRIMTEYAHSVTGIDIHPGATIGPEFCIDHGTGIVIGETTMIGTRVKLYQGVTLGALSVDKSMAATKRHPTIEDDVIIYAGATILGGETVIGHNSIIGGNVWLTQSVPPSSVVYHEDRSKVKARSDKG